MKNFSYKRINISDESNFIEEKKKQVNIQRLVYLYLFFGILATLLIYGYYKLRWISFDGFVMMDKQRISLMADSYITAINVHTGAVVNEGDTLFNFMITAGIEEQYKLSEMTWIEKEHFSTSQRRLSLENRLENINEHIKDIETEMEIARRHVFLGVISELELKAINNQYRDLIYEKKLTENEIAINTKYLNVVNEHLLLSQKKRSPEEFTLEALRNTSFQAYIHPFIAKNDGTVISIQSTEGSYCYKSEPLMYIQPSADILANLHIKFYVPINYLGNIAVGQTVEVVFGKRNIELGVITLIGYDTEDLPENLRKPFERNTRMVLARVEFLNYAQLNNWKKTSGLPITIRKKRFE